MAFTNLINDDSCVTLAEDINLNVSSIQKIMVSACAPLFKRNIKRVTDYYTFNESKQPWLSDVCKKEICFKGIGIFTGQISMIVTFVEIWSMRDQSIKK